MYRILRYEKFNEGVKEWIATAMLLVNLGFFSSNVLANSDSKEEVKNVVDDLNNSDIDSLKILEKINDNYEKDIFSDYIGYNKLSSLYEESKKDTIFEGSNLLDYLKYVESSKPVGVNCILIDLPINDRVLKNVPLYNFSVDAGKVKLDVSSMLTKDISINIDLKNNMKFTFMHNIMFTSVGVKYKLKK